MKQGLLAEDFLQLHFHISWILDENYVCVHNILMVFCQFSMASKCP